MKSNEDTILGQSLLDYYRGLDKSKIILLFKGAMSQDTLVRIGDLIRLPSEEMGADNYSKRLFAVMVEMAQNILFYSQEREVLPIICGNRVNPDQKARLEAQCQKVNGMSQDELREYYSQQRRKMVHEGSKGAGLGLIDIAKRSKNPLVYDFHPMDEDQYFFSLSVHINREPQ
jgi:hypothetical protein